MSAITQYGVLLYLDRQATLRKVAKNKKKRQKDQRRSSNVSKQTASVAWSSSTSSLSRSMDSSLDLKLRKRVDANDSFEEAEEEMEEGEDIKLRLQQIDRWSFVLFPTVSFIIAVTYWVYFLNKR